MTTFNHAWTPAQDKILRDNPKLSNGELAELVNQIGPHRTLKGVSNRRSRLSGKRQRGESNAWTPEEKALLKRLYPTTSDPDLAKALAAAGFKRSIEGIKRARQRYGLINEREPEEREYVPGWCALPGSFAERDSLFVQAVIREALRLGLYRREAA